MQSGLERRTIRKVLWRIIPAIFICTSISYLDRANIGYAALQMNQELALTSSAFSALLQGYSSSATFSSKYRAILRWRASAPVSGLHGF